MIQTPTRPETEILSIALPEAIANRDYRSAESTGGDLPIAIWRSRQPRHEIEGIANPFPQIAKLEAIHEMNS